MRRTSPSSYIRVASLLLMLLLLSAGNHRALGPAVLPGGQFGECSDLPTNCKRPVKYLGESKGCACFACEYRRSTQKILCTESETDKRAFKALLPRPGSPTD
ncbi:MAG TPA: hypothetical protein VN282_07025 [Pyrinomonadaceae bacterium]|nr:hypothetical protein [Pyrinomonadaceae bacterium]